MEDIKYTGYQESMHPLLTKVKAFVSSEGENAILTDNKKSAQVLYRHLAVYHGMIAKGIEYPEIVNAPKEEHTYG